MKNLLLVSSFLLLLLFTSCEPKYERLIDDYMKESLHDYSSYEPISFEVDTIMRIVDSDFRHLIIDREIRLSSANYRFESNKKTSDEYFKKWEYSSSYMSDSYAELYEKYRVLASLYLDTCAILSREIDSLNLIGDGMDKEIASFSITHKYRANNGHGALRLGTIEFIINKDMTEVINSVNIK